MGRSDTVLCIGTLRQQTVIATRPGCEPATIAKTHQGTGGLMLAEGLPHDCVDSSMFQRWMTRHSLGFSKLGSVPTHESIECREVLSRSDHG